MEVLANVNELSVRYGTVQAVDTASFEVNAGEIAAIIGPNGSGKTSSVECLCGLRSPSGGAVAVFGSDPHADRREIYKQLGVQLQESSYPEKIKVGELCEWFSSFYENPADYRKLLVQLGLSEKEKSYVSKLSGGQKQRLSIALAMLPRPRLLVLDELTTGLDPEARRSIWEILRVIKSGGVGILLVSHYMDEVENLADKIIFMQSGKVIFSGTLDGLRAFAKESLNSDLYDPQMSLEEIYLAFSPEQKSITLEGLM